MEGTGTIQTERKFLISNGEQEIIVDEATALTLLTPPRGGTAQEVLSLLVSNPNFTHMIQPERLQDVRRVLSPSPISHLPRFLSNMLNLFGKEVRTI